jgi:hypothetical protein
VRVVVCPAKTDGENAVKVNPIKEILSRDFMIFPYVSSGDDLRFFEAIKMFFAFFSQPRCIQHKPDSTFKT